MRIPTRYLLVAVVVLVAGAAALFLSASGVSIHPGDDVGNEPRDELPADPDTVLTRVESLTGSREAEDVRLVLRDPEEMSFDRDPPPRFHVLLGVAEVNDSATAVAYTTPDGTVVVDRRLTDHPAMFESVLSQEFTHVLQYDADAPDRIGSNVPDDAGEPGDGAMVRRSVFEGVAVYTQQAYWQQYVGEGPSPAGQVRSSYENASGRQKYLLSSHYWGYRYVDATVDSPEAASTLYDDPPRTTEELIHRRPPGSEPVAPLSVSVQERGWNRSRPRARMGELFVRLVLADGLNRSRAAAGADGWGNDVRIALTDGDRRGYVWVTKWDDRANATEFERAFRASMDRTASGSGDGWRRRGGSIEICAADGRIVVICAGNESFVEGTAVDFDGDEVTVRPPRVGDDRSLGAPEPAADRPIDAPDGPPPTRGADPVPRQA